MKIQKNIIKKVIYLISFFILNLIIQWIFFESFELIRTNYNFLVINILILIICVFVQTILYKFVNPNIFITIGGILFTSGLIAIFSFSDPFYVLFLICGYALLIPPLWKNTLDMQIPSKLNQIIIVMSFVFGFSLQYLTFLNGFNFLSEGIIWIAIIIIIIIIYLTNWIYIDITINNSTDYNFNISDKYKLELGISHSIIVGISLFLILTTTKINLFPLNYFSIDISFTLQLIILVMGLMVILTVIYSNFKEKSSHKIIKWTFYIFLLLSVTISICLLILTLNINIWNPYLVIIPGILSFICIFMLIIIQSGCNYIWWISISLIITFGGQIILILFPNLILPLLLISLIQIILGFWNYDNITILIPTLNEIKRETNSE